MQIGRLRDIREEHDLTQTEVARELHVCQKTYSDYERGIVRISGESLAVLAKFYNTSIDYLMGLTDEPKPYPRSKNKSSRTL